MGIGVSVLTALFSPWPGHERLLAEVQLYIVELRNRKFAKNARENALELNDFLTAV